LATVASLALVMSAGAWHLNRKQTEAFEKEARNRSNMVLGFGQACRSYTKEVLRPAVEAHTDEMIFEAMSSTFVTNGVLSYFNEKMPEYSYRQPTINPLNLDNEANESERTFLEAFAADRDLQEVSGYRTENGHRLEWHCRVFFLAHTPRDAG